MGLAEDGGGWWRTISRSADDADGLVHATGHFFVTNPLTPWSPIVPDKRFERHTAKGRDRQAGPHRVVLSC